MSKFEKIGQQEIEELYNKYAKNWGRVNFESFKELMYYKYKIEGDANTRILRFIFEALDGEGLFNFDDGHLNLDEFNNIMFYFPKEMTDQYANLVTILFNILDKNHNNEIDIRELTFFFRKLRSQVPRLISQQMMLTFDKNEDGVMQFEEFKEFLKNDYL